MKELSFSGNPSEVALLRFACQHVKVHDVRAKYQPVFEIPFNSARKWSMVIVRDTSTGHEKSDDGVGYQGRY